MFALSAMKGWISIILKRSVEYSNSHRQYVGHLIIFIVAVACDLVARCYRIDRRRQMTNLSRSLSTDIYYLKICTSMFHWHRSMASPNLVLLLLAIEITNWICSVLALSVCVCLHFVIRCLRPSLFNWNFISNAVVGSSPLPFPSNNPIHICWKKKEQNIIVLLVYRVSKLSECGSDDGNGNGVANPIESTMIMKACVLRFESECSRYSISHCQWHFYSLLFFCYYFCVRPLRSRVFSILPSPSHTHKSRFYRVWCCRRNNSMNLRSPRELKNTRHTQFIRGGFWSECECIRYTTLVGIPIAVDDNNDDDEVGVRLWLWVTVSATVSGRKILFFHQKCARLSQTIKTRMLVQQKKLRKYLQWMQWSGNIFFHRNEFDRLSHGEI